MSIVNGWFDWATRIDGVPDKVYSQANSGAGIACHSVVGREGDFEDGVPNRFLCTDKVNGRYTANCAASSMFVLRLSGELIQMYPVTASTWTSGGAQANCSYWAIEAEGGYAPNFAEKLTKEQEDTFIRLVDEWEQYTGKNAVPNFNILQHKQIAQRFGYDATACASDRYSNAWARVSAGERYEGDDALKLTEEQTENLLLRVFAGSEYEGVESRAQRLERAMGELAKCDEVQSVNDTAVSAISVAMDYAEALSTHVNNHPGNGGGAIPAHTHVPGGVQDG